MAKNGNNALGNALSAANAVRGAVKTGKAIAAAAKGGAAGRSCRCGCSIRL